MSTELKVEVLKQGDGGRVTKKGEKIKMHYQGKLDNGSEFDSSYNRNEPFEFVLGAGMVIAGWDQGLEGMSKGEVRQLTIPHNLGYGDQGYPPVIPPRSTLHFRVELLGWAN